MRQNLKQKLGNTIRCVPLLSLLLLAVSTTSFALPIRFGVGPDNNQSLLLSHIQSASQTLTINIYHFDHPLIARALIAKINAGVTVRILIEGQPFGGISPNGNTILNALAAAMARSANPGNQLLVMSKSETGEKRRFRYDHAKYVIADHQRSLISSENFTESAHANPGGIGNRGWDAVIDDSRIAEQLEDIYLEDSDPRYGDVKPLRATSQNVQLPAEKGLKPRPIPGIRQGAGDASRATLITSPDAVDELVQLLRSARTSIAIEHMSLPSNWRYKPNPGQNPVVTELIRAAQRGVEVRVLLNDERVFGISSGNSSNDEEEDPSAPKRPNQVTVELFNSVAASEHLPLAARIVNVREAGITYIHNKGMVIDGHKALVSSINGSQTSVMKNREVAVLLESQDAANYYGNVFDFDWESSDVQSVRRGGGFSAVQLFEYFFVQL